MNKGKATKPGETGNIGKYKHVYSNMMGAGHLRYDKEEEALIGDWSSSTTGPVNSAVPQNETQKIIKQMKVLDDVSKLTKDELIAKIKELDITVSLEAPNPGVLVMRLRNAVRTALKKN